jgi:hypothetical protein
MLSWIKLRQKLFALFLYFSAISCSMIWEVIVYFVDIGGIFDHLSLICLSMRLDWLFCWYWWNCWDHHCLNFKRKTLSSKLHTKRYVALWDMHKGLYDPIYLKYSKIVSKLHIFAHTQHNTYSNCNNINIQFIIAA